MEACRIMTGLHFLPLPIQQDLKAFKEPFDASKEPFDAFKGL